MRRRMPPRPTVAFGTPLIKQGARVAKFSADGRDSDHILQRGDGGLRARSLPTVSAARVAPPCRPSASATPTLDTSFACAFFVNVRPANGRPHDGRHGSITGDPGMRTSL